MAATDTNNAIKCDKELIRFEYEPNKFIKFDVVELQLRIEGWAAEGKEAPKVIKELQDFLRAAHQIEVSTAMAWTILRSTAVAFQEFKKKLDSNLDSLFGTNLTQESSPTTS